MFHPRTKTVTLLTAEILLGPFQEAVGPQLPRGAGPAQVRPGKQAG
jgi:hypothetical protein